MPTASTHGVGTERAPSLLRTRTVPARDAGGKAAACTGGMFLRPSLPLRRLRAEGQKKRPLRHEESASRCI